jgi:hypothetical protein
MYAIHGGLCLLLSTNVRRFGPVITYVALVEILFAPSSSGSTTKAACPRVDVTEAPMVLLISARSSLRRRAAV